MVSSISKQGQAVASQSRNQNNESSAAPSRVDGEKSILSNKKMQNRSPPAESIADNDYDQDDFERDEPMKTAAANSNS